MVAGTGEPGRVLLGADCRGGAGTGEPGRCCWGQIAGAAQERECRGGAARRGAVEGKKKIKASTFLCKPFSILHICGEPFNGDAENAGKYDKFIIGYKAQAGFYAADRLAPYAKTGHLEFGGKCVLREALCGAGLNGGAWQTGTVNSKEIIGTNVVVFVNVPNFGQADTITGVRVYDINGALAGQQSISLKRTSLNVALLRFTFPLIETEE